MKSTSFPFELGDLVEVSTHDVHSGPLEFSARVVRQISDTHVMVSVAGTRFFAVPIVDCAHASSQEKEEA